MNVSEECAQLVEEIIRQIRDLPSVPHWARYDIAEKQYKFPIFLFVGEDKSIEISPEIEKSLITLSKSLMANYFSSYKEKFTNSEWEKMIKRAFGLAFTHRDNQVYLEKDAKGVLEFIVKKLCEWIHGIQEREYTFGCHFCNIPDLEPLSIGPVRFEPRVVWLNRMFDEGNISKVSVSRITKIWEGKRFRKRKFSEDELREREILGTIGKSEFVCSVTVAKTGAEAGLQKAATAARLAMTVIALAWDKPSSTLNYMTLIFDGEPHAQQSVIFVPEGLGGFSVSRSYIPGGVTWLKEEEWDSLRINFRETFSCGGYIIGYFLGNFDETQRPKVFNVLLQSILWFHEGCREKIDLMAIVKFWSAMEALSGGRNKEGVLNLVEARLTVKDKQRLVKEINEIYRDGRSRTVHGTNDKLGYDWSDLRNRAERLARQCLISCLDWTSKHPDAKDPKLLSSAGT